MAKPTAQQDYAMLKEQMVEIANRHQEAMQGMNSRAAGAYVRDAIANAPIMFGVYQDLGEPNGVGMHVIKGKRELQVSVASNETIQTRIDAVPCIELEQAIAAEQVLGDGKIRNDS
jgi:hypothetical protein